MCGIFVAAIIYGMLAYTRWYHLLTHYIPGVILVLFFRCMGALLNPAGHRKEGIRWGLVAHTVAMFVFLTINVCINFALQSISYVDDREFSGGSTTPRGPYGYQAGLLRSNPMNSVPNMMFYLNLWLADGLLVSSVSNPVIRMFHTGHSPSSIVATLFIQATGSSPSHSYCTSPLLVRRIFQELTVALLAEVTGIATCIMSIIQLIHPDGVLHSTIKFPLVSYPATLSLTILLTLMIIIRLTLHGRNIQRVLGSGSNGSGLYKTIVTALIESYALYALTFIVWLALSSANNPTSLVFAPILLESQVCTISRFCDVLSPDTMLSCYGDK